jgi:hypothetical protein
VAPPTPLCEKFHFRHQGFSVLCKKILSSNHLKQTMKLKTCVRFTMRMSNITSTSLLSTLSWEKMCYKKTLQFYLCNMTFLFIYFGCKFLCLKLYTYTLYIHYISSEYHLNIRHFLAKIKKWNLS